MIRLITDQRWVSRIFRHVLLFVSTVLIFSWLLYFKSLNGNSFFQNFLVVLVNAFFFFGYGYLSVYIFIPKLLVRKKIGLFIAVLLISGLALSALKYLVSDLAFYHVISPENGLTEGSARLSDLLMNTKDMTFIVALFAIVKYARDHYLLESNIRELQQKGLEAEIKLLEHQMDPHVIFNNFNSLYSISLNRPALLGETVKKLQSVLHYLFRESKFGEVELSREIEMIENYMGLEKLRFGERLEIKFEMEGKPQGLKIAPLILYPFVENCFVHGAGEDPDSSWIHIRMSINGNKLQFCASNSVSGRGSNILKNGKSGNENSVRRLEIQYPNNHRLTILDRENKYVVELNISLAR
jgi:two-component system, LytTR family, sensor kinase